MTRTQKVLRFVGVLSALLAFLSIVTGFGAVLDFEERGIAGVVVIWLARIGALGLGISIAAAAVSSRLALGLLCFASICVAPLLTYFVFPHSWCLFFECGGESPEFFWLPGNLLPVASLIVAIVGLHLSHRK